MSFVVVPVRAIQDVPTSAITPAFLRPRKVKAGESVWIKEALRKPYFGDTTGSDTKFFAAGPLARRLGLGGQELSLDQVVHSIILNVLSGAHVRGSGTLIRKKWRKKTDHSDKEAVFSATTESRVSSVIHLVDWQTRLGKSQPWDDWVQTFDDPALRDNIYKRMFYGDFVEPITGYTGRQTIDLKSMLVGNRLRTDMNGMTFFDPTTEFKFIVYPEGRERYPNYSALRWMAFSLFQDAAVSAMQRMIQQFHSDEGDNTDILRHFSRLEEAVRSFGELYDLDIRYPIYRSEYQGIRDLANIDKDYVSLRQRMISSREDATLREQRLFNKLLVALAVGTLTLTMVTFVAQGQTWSAGSYVGLGLPLVAAMTYFSIKLFDPFRRLFIRKLG